MQLLNVYFSSELDNMTERHSFLCVSHKEGFGYERCVFIKYLWLQQPVEAGAGFILF